MARASKETATAETPFRQVWGVEDEGRDLLVFGCECAYVEDEENRDKFEGRSERMVFVAYAQDGGVDALDLDLFKREKKIRTVRTRNFTADRSSFPPREIPRDTYTLDLLFLGVNRRGKVTTVCPSQQVFLSYLDETTDETGEPVYTGRIRTTENGKLGFGWQPNNQHTVTKDRVQPCETCHIKEDESNIDQVMGTYGFGTGLIFEKDENGVEHDLTRVLDEHGDPIVDFAHEGSGTVPKDMIDRALDVRVP